MNAAKMSFHENRNLTQAGKEKRPKNTKTITMIGKYYLANYLPSTWSETMVVNGDITYPSASVHHFFLRVNYSQPERHLNENLLNYRTTSQQRKCY